MNKKFNINGTCFPEYHYMVNLNSRLQKIRAMVDEGEYFVINRARQYGKTTTLLALKRALDKDYTIFSISFEGMGILAYNDEHGFCKQFCTLINDAISYGEVDGIPQELRDYCAEMAKKDNTAVFDLSGYICTICKLAEKPVLLLIDEVDAASNYEAFISFLGVLRSLYLKRFQRPTFKSVILAGVYDIRNLKLKVRSDEQRQYNSPWNIAAPFDVDMSFSAEDISGMLTECEAEHRTNMDIAAVAQLIYDYTSGYPFLVSRLCKLIDETPYTWDSDGVEKAVKVVLNERNTLFDDMIKKICDNSELAIMLQKILFCGCSFPHNAYNFATDIGSMFGLLTNKNGETVISNRIYETMLYNYFLREDNKNGAFNITVNSNQFVADGYLDMDMVMTKFVEYFTEIYGDNDRKFIEENGRRLFLLYLKPIINGTGNYYVEARTRDMLRTDIVVDYLGKRYIIELKIWHGDEYNKKGEEQLARYLDCYKQDKGWLLTFSFNKDKEAGTKTVNINGKTIFEAVV